MPVIIEQISGGYKVQTLNAGGAGANTTAVTQSDGATGSTVATRVIVLGAESPQTISGNKIITFPVLTENLGFGAATSPGGSNTQVQYNNSGAFGGDADLIWTAGTGLIINSQKELRLADSDDSAYIGQKAAGTTTSYTITWPAAVAGGNGYVLKSTTGGVLSWAEESAGGTSWQAIKTGTYTASAGEGVFANTTSGAFTVNLPSSPSLGDEVSIVDYAGTFDTNNLTVGRNSQPIMGTAADLTVSIERAGLTLVYVDGTQGWLLKDK